MASTFVGIDFGTEGTGASIGTSENKIYAHAWDTRTSGSDRFKTRTALLLKRDYTPVLFGDAAYDMYADLMARDPTNTLKELLFFDYFKMALAGDAKTPTVKAVTGELVPAYRVFVGALTLIYQSIFERLKQSSGNNIRARDTMWIITVPTLWSETANQIMRSAARSAFADVKDAQIKLVREPEAASWACRAQQITRKLSVSSSNTSTTDLLKVDSQFAVADLGAGTADFSQLQVAKDGTLKETAAASGGPWGGRRVERAFLDALESVLGFDAMEQFRKSEPAANLELERNIRTLKHRVDPTTPSSHRLPLPWAFVNVFKLQERATAHKKATGQSELPLDAPGDAKSKDTKSDDKDTKSEKESGDMKAAASAASGAAAAAPNVPSIPSVPPGSIIYTNGLFRLSHAFVLSLFEEPKKAIVEHLAAMFQANPKISILFVVGGFAESRVILHAIDAMMQARAESAAAPSAAGATMDKKSSGEALSAPLRVLPTDPGLCVMNGAVHFGINPSLISSRIAKMAFGVQTSHRWDAQRHSGREKDYRSINGQEGIAYCDTVFQAFCQPGDSIEIDQGAIRTFSPGHDNQSQFGFVVYATPKKDVGFVDDPSMIKIGTITLRCPLPEDAKNFGLDRIVQVTMKFGCTEIGVSAVETTSRARVDASINCVEFDLDGTRAVIERR